MGNIGRSSTGCVTCRKRKIKCDETRPGCRRCAQVRRPCPGYPFQIQLDVRLAPENLPPPLPRPVPVPTVQYEPIAKIGATQPLPVEAYLPTSTIALPPTLPSLSPFVHIPDVKVKDEGKDDALVHSVPKHDGRPESPPKYDIQHQSICFFVHLFCFQAGKLYSFPVIDFVPYILQNAHPRSSVSLAATAVSRMTLADQYSGTDIRLQTGYDYSRALASTQASLRNPSSATTDSTVVAVWLLGLYEAINSVLSHGRASATKQDTKTHEEEWQSHILHIRGAMRLLKLRGESQLSNPRSEKIFRVFKAAIQMRLFMLNSVTSRDFGDLELDVYADEHEFVPSETAAKASAFFLHIARLQEKIKHFLVFSDRTTPAEEETSKKTYDLIAYGESLDKAMLGWSDVEPGWQMMKVRASPKGTAWSLYPNHALYYLYSFWVFLYWIRLLMARLKLYEALIELVKSDPLLQPHKATAAAMISMKHQIESYKMIITLTASEIIGLTAYALGDVASTGHFLSAVNTEEPGGKRGTQEMNVIAAMQLVVPLKCLGRSEYMTGQQRGAIDLAIGLIGDGYRRRPGGWS